MVSKKTKVVAGIAVAAAAIGADAGRVPTRNRVVEVLP